MISLYDRICVDGSKLTVEFSSDFISTNVTVDNFWMISGIDMASLDESILNIPMLLNLAPAIWAMNLHVSIPRMDRELSLSLDRLKLAFKKMYPNLNWGGDIVASSLIENDGQHNRSNALFFSGGVDSVFSAMQHFDEKPLLVTVRGSDVALADDNGWNLVKKQTKEFAEIYSLPFVCIESNFYDFLNQSLLSSLDSEIMGWWAGVQHGMGFSGLMAPFVITKSLSSAYIASTHSTGFTAPWGSSPRIDNLINYAGLQFFHDGFEYTRHGKLKSILNLCAEKGIKVPCLRVCYSNKLNAGENCCVCEKCSRTMTGLWVEKQNPYPLGFEISVSDYVKNVMTKFKYKNYFFDENTLHHWQDIKNGLREPSDYLEVDLPIEIINYLEWLRNFDFIEYKEECDIRKKRRQNLLKFIRYIPGLYPLARSVKRLTRGWS
jgi:hypothetical protein